jgi:hypothetical protein
MRGEEKMKQKSFELCAERACGENPTYENWVRFTLSIDFILAIFTSACVENPLSLATSQCWVLGDCENIFITKFHMFLSFDQSTSSSSQLRWDILIHERLLS